MANREKVIIAVMILFGGLMCAGCESRGATIHYAMEDKPFPLNMSAVRSLLADNPKLVNAKNRWGDSLLHRACMRAHKDRIKFLIDNGADVNIKNTSGDTPLHNLLFTIFSTPIKESVELLINAGADVNAKGRYGWTPLHSTVQRRRQQDRRELVELLMANGANVRAKDGQGMTPLHWAAKWPDKELVELLATGAQINARDKLGRTPTFVAIFWHNKDVVDFLRKEGGVLSDVKVHDAALEGNLRKVQALLSQEPKLIKSKDGLKWTPLHFAALAGKRQAVELLLSRGAKVNGKGKHGWTALHCAAYKGHKEVVELLLANGANVNARASRLSSWPGWRETPLQVAERQGFTNVAQLLRKAGAVDGARRATVTIK